jgi:DNA-binding FadR family transcriptional regulator
MTDVARLAGCSQTTVSLVLTRKAGVKISQEVREAVEAAARSLGYAAKAEAPRAPPRFAAAPKRPSERATSQTDKVVREIGLAITSGRFPANGLLPRDAELMRHFDVSRTVLREALKILSGKGLVRSKTRVGTRVRNRSEWSLFDPELLMWHASTGFDEHFIKYVGEIRLALEPEAAALAALRHSERDLDVLRGYVERMEQAMVSLRDFVDADLAFHLAVAEASGNPFMRAISALIEIALNAALAKSWPGDEPQGVARSAADHRAILEAIAARDPERARATMLVVIAEGVSRAEGRGGVSEPGAQRQAVLF